MPFKYLWSTAAALIILFGTLPLTSRLLPSGIVTAGAQENLPPSSLKGHPMRRTWPMLADVKPHFLTSVMNGRRDLWPCFSADGLSILFSRVAQGNIAELVRVPVTGGKVETFLRSDRSISATRASWSPKNDLVAFTGIAASGIAAIWLVNGDGTGAHALDAPGFSDQMFYPAWYPDGNRLAAMDGRNLVIRSFDLKGGRLMTMTDHESVLTGRPSVSPDGKWIAFAGQRNAGQAYDQEENVIWLVSDRGALETLEVMPVQGRSPAWSPDGARIAFESDRGSGEGRYALFVIGRDGGGLIQVTDYGLNATHPGWSPDGRRLVFDAKDPERINAYGIAVIDVPAGK